MISKIVRHNERPVILETSASVHSGNSGGLLVDKDGRFLGVVTCNIRHTDHTSHGNIIPKLNFSIPVSELMPFFQFVKHRDKGVLSAFDFLDKDVKALWQLQQTQAMDKPQVPGEKFREFLKGLKSKL